MSGSTCTRSGLSLVLTFVAAFGVVAMGPEVSLAGVPPISRCPEAQETNYEPPIARLPAIPSVPPSGDLPFGPPRLSLVPFEDQVLVGRGLYGYELVLKQSRVGKRVSVDWLVDLRLSRLSPKGKAIQRYPGGTRVVETIANKEFNGQRLALQAPGKPGLYLFELAFRKRGEKSSFKTYAQYLRVVRPVLDAHLIVGRPIAKPGESIPFWIENRGTKTIDPQGEGFTFERYTASGWERDPASPRVFRRIRLLPLYAGEAGFCRSFRIPVDTPPGSYRFSKKVVVSGTPSPRILWAEFEVQTP